MFASRIQNVSYPDQSTACGIIPGSSVTTAETSFGWREVNRRNERPSMLDTKARTAFLMMLLLSCGMIVGVESAQEPEIRIFPKRTDVEAAVLEWGNSAIISALDASVATFGPQTDEAALLEVECMPILASPLTGVDPDTKEVVTKLENAEEVHGNMVVMTLHPQQDQQEGGSSDWEDEDNEGVPSSVTGLQLARIARASGAAALLVVNFDPNHPDDIYRLKVVEGKDEVDEASEIDIPVVMISFNSANVLTTATVEQDTPVEDIVNNGMPERVRLYAGGDRPYFEDVSALPTVYLIHNLLTAEECDQLLPKAQRIVKRIGNEDSLLGWNINTNSMSGMKAGVLHQGAFQTPGSKAMEERMEQVTGFPKEHYTDYIAYEFTHPRTSEWSLHHDNGVVASGTTIAMSTVTVYLTDAGPTVVYPNAMSNKKQEIVEIQPRKGMAVVHHNTNENYKPIKKAAYAMRRTSPAAEDDEPSYILRKYILTEPLPYSRRFVVPGLSMVGVPLDGLYGMMLERFGVMDGPGYFDKLVTFGPLALVLLLVQVIVSTLTASSNKANSGASSNSKKSTKKSGSAGSTPKTSGEDKASNSSSKTSKRKPKGNKKKD